MFGGARKEKYKKKKKEGPHRLHFVEATIHGAPQGHLEIFLEPKSDRVGTTRLSAHLVEKNRSTAATTEAVVCQSIERTWC